MPQISIRKVIIVIAIIVLLSQVGMFIKLVKLTWSILCVCIEPLQNEAIRYPVALLLLVLFWMFIFKLLFRR